MVSPIVNGVEGALDNIVKFVCWMHVWRQRLLRMVCSPGVVAVVVKFLRHAVSCIHFVRRRFGISAQYV